MTTIHWKRHSFQKLPSELLERLERAAEHPISQNDIFSELHPHGKYAVRWHKPLECFPYPHRVMSSRCDQRILLNVLDPDLNRVLTLKCENGAWHRIANSTLYRLAGMLHGSQYNCINRALPPASPGQLALVAKLIATIPDRLPPLNRKMAAIIIDTALMARHWRRINVLVTIWITEIRQDNSSQ